MPSNSKPTKAAAAQRITKLKELIGKYRYEYHVNNKSILSEAAADSLKHELSQLEELYPELITADSPTQRVAGEPLPEFSSYEHKWPMLSLNDVFDETELKAWEDRIAKLIPDKDMSYFVDIKMDGLACSLIYENGELVRGVTRGDGYVGEDVTHNVRTLESIPLNLHKGVTNKELLKGYTEIRGEIVMYKDDFAKLNQQRKKDGLELFANPRNLAAGTMRQLDPSLIAARPLHFHAYDLLRENREDISTNELCYGYLKELGFIINQQAARKKDINSVLSYALDWEEKRQSLNFNTDGMVIKVNNRGQFERLGVVGKAPRGAIAYKYPAEQATTKVRDIQVNVGRTGAVTPFAVLEPVTIAGTTVQMATLHNGGEIKRKDIRIGDSVIVQKAGDIIPEVVESLKSLRSGSEKVFKMPTKCPECDSALTKKEDEAVLRCSNLSCPARTHRQLEHFVSRGALDIDGVGERVVKTFLDEGLIADSADLFKLRAEQISQLEGFKDKSAENIIKAIEAVKNPPLDRFLFALGIRHVGIQTARDLANAFGDLDSLREATVDELAEVEGVGEIVAESIAAWFIDEENQQLLAKFAGLGVAPQRVEVSRDDRLSGKTFVITGTLEGLAREEAEEKIRALGGKVSSSVSAKTNYLVVGDNPGENKLSQAKEHYIKIVDESELQELLRS
ncbi:MAG: NAD-dependent DNA ligase LigA [Candidatus Saccharimonadales bacterium]